MRFTFQQLACLVAAGEAGGLLRAAVDRERDRAARTEFGLQLLIRGHAEGRTRL